MRRALIVLLLTPSLAFAGWVNSGGVAQPSDTSLTLGQIIIGGSNGRAAAVSVTGDLTFTSTAGGALTRVVTITNTLPSLTATTLNATNAIVSGSTRTATIQVTTGGNITGVTSTTTTLLGTTTNSGTMSGGGLAGAITNTGTMSGGTLNPTTLQVSGTAVNSFKITGTASATVNFGVVGALGASAEQAVAVAGCADGDRVDIGLPSTFSSTIISVKYRILASGTVGLTAFSIAGLTDSNHTVTITTHNP